MNYEKLKNIKALVLDVDGVLTNGKIWLDTDSEWKREFCVKDGVGIKRLLEAKYQVAVITGGKSHDVRTRAKFLGILHFYEGALNKEPSYEDLKSKTGFQDSELCYIGDEIFDLPIIRSCGFGVTVASAVDEVREGADYITRSPGGDGAVREICDLLMNHGYYSR